MPRVSPEVVDKWIDLGREHGTGNRLAVMFASDGSMSVRRTLPEAAVAALREHNRLGRDVLRKGRMLGNTQRHWLLVGSAPAAVIADQREKYGADWADPKVRARFWNDPDNRHFRASEHRL